MNLTSYLKFTFLIGIIPQTSVIFVNWSKISVCDFLLRRSQKYRPERNSFLSLEPNEIFNDFAISREPFEEIDSDFLDFKGMD